jgi:hypothetical protein
VAKINTLTEFNATFRIEMLQAKIFEPEAEIVTKGQRKVRKWKFHGAYLSSDINRKIKPRRMQWRMHYVRQA